MKNNNSPIPGHWEGNSFYADTGRRPRRDMQQPLTFGDEQKPYSGHQENGRDIRSNGKTWCSKHPGIFYDPKKYNQCYICYKARNDEKK